MHELTPGETLLITTGRTATVTATRTEYLTTPVKIYNFEVADWHTYHAGSTQTGWVWVHNTCHGNSLRAKRHNHRYEIYNKSTGDVVKTGISGQKLNINGSSPRANRQLAQFGDKNLAARVVEKKIPGRAKAKVREQKATNRLDAQGHSLRRQTYPRPES